MGKPKLYYHFSGLIALGCASVLELTLVRKEEKKPVAYPVPMVNYLGYFRVLPPSWRGRSNQNQNRLASRHSVAHTI